MLSHGKGMFILLCLFNLYFVRSDEMNERPCSPSDELPCDNGGCVHKMQWCDSIVDCSDGSDEDFCDNKRPCLEHHFECEDGRCIPMSGVCDSYQNCKDGSDELDCDYSMVDNRIAEFETQTEDLTVQNAVSKAADYIIRHRGADFSWGPFTPRAAVALSFAKYVSKSSDVDRNLMKSQLNILLSLDLMKNATLGNLGLGRLAMYINALYATCQDPRYFQGMDLVTLLRSGTDAALQSGNFSLPSVLLTLCVAGRSTYEDYLKLSGLYGKMGREKTDLKAISLLAMACMVNDTRLQSYHLTSHLKTLQSQFEGFIGNSSDVYTEALILQAASAFNIMKDKSSLLERQQPDGSFGDLLATYYAIPALLNKNLLKLRENCHEKMTAESSLVMPLLQKSSTVFQVSYSLWISNGKDVTSHLMFISITGNKTFYDVMRIAQERDQIFRFSYDETSQGKMVYSIAGIPNDAETGRSWILYRGLGQIKVNSKTNLLELTTGVDSIHPNPGDHFIFWLKYGM